MEHHMDDDDGGGITDIFDGAPPVALPPRPGGAFA